MIIITIHIAIHIAIEAIRNAIDAADPGAARRPLRQAGGDLKGKDGGGRGWTLHRPRVTSKGCELKKMKSVTFK